MFWYSNVLYSNLFIVFSVFFLFSHQTYSQCSSNLILNPSFELGINDWSPNANADYTISIGGLATDGQAYLNFEQFNMNAEAQVEQIFNVLPLTNYAVSFNAGVELNCGQQVAIKSKASNGTTLSTIILTIDHPVSAGFLSDYYTVIQTPLNTATIDLEFEITGCGSFYVDQVCVSEVFPDWDCFSGADRGTNALYGVNPSQGLSVQIGPYINADEIESMTYDPSENILYAVNENTLGTIDINLGTFTPCASIIGSGDGPQGFIAFNDVDGLSWDFLTNTIIASARRVQDHDILFRIDPNTCQVVQDAYGTDEYIEIQGPGVLLDIDDITFQPTTGLLYAANTFGGSQLITVDRNTGAASVVGPFNVEDVEGLSFNESGILYATTGWQGTPPNSYFSVNPNTGNATLLGTFSSGEDFESIQCLTDPILGSVCGNVFEDLNDDDIGDIGLPFVTVLLYDLNGEIAYVTLTETDGSYCFLDIPISTYTIVELDPGQYVSVWDIDGGDPNSITVEVLGDQTITGQNFVDERGPCLTEWDAPIVENENTETCISETVVFDVSTNDTDVFGVGLEYSIINDVDFGTATMTDQGVLTYVPSAFFNGAEIIFYQACIDNFDPCLSYGPFVCGEGIEEMTVVYTGNEVVDINLNYTNNNVNFQNIFNVAPGDTIVFDSPTENWSWDIYVDGVFNVTLITDCTYNYLAQNQGSFFILSFVDEDNVVNEPDPIGPHCDYGFIAIDIDADPIANAGNDVTISCGSSALIGGAPAGNLGAEYIWSSGQSGTITNANNGQISVAPLITTTYTLTIISGGCSITDQIVVTVEELEVDLGLQNQIICEQETVLLDPSINSGIPPYSYSWSDGSTTASITVSPSANINYSVTVTDLNQCTGTDDVNIFVNTNPNLFTGLDQTISCGGGTVTIGGDPVSDFGATYTWSTGQTGVISAADNGQITVSPTTTTAYTISVMANGCTVSDDVIVTVEDLEVDLGDDTQDVCLGIPTTFTAVVNNGQAPYQYLWSTGSTNPSITVTQNANTIYTVQVTDALGCVGTDQVLAVVNPNPAIDAGSNQVITCGGTATIGGNPVGIPGASYSWSTGESGVIGGLDNGQINVSPQTTTTYTLTVTTTGCEVTEQVTVIVDGLDVDLGDLNQDVCFGIPATFTAIVNNGQAPYQYLWGTGSTDASITVSPTVNTTYSVQVTDALGCVGNDVVFVVVNPNPAINTGPDQTITCGGTATIGGSPVGISGATYSWSSGQSGTISGADNGQITVSPLVTTTYTLTLTTIGCEVSEDITVTVEDLDVDLGDATQDVCLGVPATFTAIVNNGQGPFQYLWSTGSTDPSITVIPTINTSYSVQVTDALGCVGSEDVFTNVNPNPGINAGPDQTITCGGSATIGGSPVGIAGATYSWSSGQNGIISGADNGQITVSPQITTSYILTITTIGCEVSEEVTVTVDELDVELGDATQAVCENIPATFTAIVSNGQGPYQYLWSTGSSEPSITVTPSANTTYTVQVTDALGCTGTDQVLAIVNPNPEIDAGSDQTIICGGTATIGGNPVGIVGATYSWSSGQSGTISAADNGQITVSPQLTTTYTLTITTVGCEVTEEVTVTVDGLDVELGDATQVVCEGVPATFTAIVTDGQGPYQYLWSTGSTEPSIEVSPSANTTYSVIVTDALGCAGTDDVFVIVNPNPAIDAGPNQTITCGGSAIIGANPVGIVGASYSWSTGESGTISGADNGQITVSPELTTSYTLTITTIGCVVTEEVIVTVEDLDVELGDAAQDVCLGIPATFTAIVANGQGPYQYLWSTGSTDPSITVTPNVNTNYSVQVTDALGCSGTDQVLAIVNPNPAIDAGVDQNITCGGAAVIGGDPTGILGATYTWSTGQSGMISAADNGQITVSPQVTTTYTLTITTVGCEVSEEVTVTVDELDVELGDATQAVCEGVPATFTAIINNGQGPFQYLWSTGSTEPSITVTPTANTSYTVEVTDALGCTGSDEVFVLLGPNPAINAGPDQTISCGGSATIGANPVAIVGANYSWSTGQSGVVSGADNGQITVSPQITTTYTLTITTIGCEVTEEVTVTVEELDVELGDATQDVCLGIPASFTAIVTSGQAPYQYLWSNGSTDPTITVTPSINTTYTVEVTDALGCVGTDEVLAIVNPNPAINAGSDQTISCGGSVTIGGNPVGLIGATYTWSSGETGIISGANNGQILVSPQVTTTYTLTITTIGCEVTEEVTVTVEELDVELGDATQDVCLGIPATFTALITNGQGPYQYLWSNGSTDPSITVLPNANTTYSVQVIDALGCIGSDEVLAIVNPNPGIDAGIDQSITCGGTVTIGGNPVGINGANYSWSTGETGTISGLDNGQITVSPQVTTTYILTITTIGCEVSEEVTITVDDLDVQLGDAVQDVCLGIPATFTANVNNGQGPFQYLWSTGSTDASITVTPNVNTTYTVQVIDALGCTGSDELLANINPAPFADAGDNAIIYCTGSVLIGADPAGSIGATYSWSNGVSGTIGPNDNGQINVSPLANTRYYLSITNGICEVVDSVDVSVEDLLVEIGPDNQILCAALGDSLVADVQVGQPPYEYLWSTGETTQVIAAEITGQYDVVVTDANGCSGSASSFVDTDDCPAVVCGNLYFDTNGNGMQDTGEPDIVGVDVVVTDSQGNVQIVTTQIDPDGDLNGVWCAVVVPGTVIVDVDETDPDFPTDVTQTEGDDPTTVVAIANEIVDGGTDGYSNLGFVCGHIYFDSNANGQQDVGEPNIPNIDVLVTASNGVQQIVVSDADGNYCAGVLPGPTIIDIDDQDADFPTNVIQTEGEDPNTVFAILGEVTDGGIDGYTEAGEVCGNIYFDTNANGMQDAGEPDLSNIGVIITDALGNIQTVSTFIDPDGDLNGVWCATVIPGVITVDVDETDPDFPDDVTQTEGDDPTTVTVIPNTTVDGGTDGYSLVGNFIGTVYFDANTNFVQDPNEFGIPNIDVEITTVDGTVITLVTDANGNYGGYGPAGLYIVDVDENDVDMPVDAWQTEGEDPNTFFMVINETVDAGNDGYSTQTQVCGNIYFDTNANGMQDAGEPDLSDIDVIITDADGNIQTVQTQVDPDGDLNGVWCAYVNAGEIIIDIDETDPDFPTGSTQTEGDDPTIINAIVGVVNDGGTDGFALVGNFFGTVYYDLNGNFTQDIGENGIENITLFITNPVGDVFTLQTDANGAYSGYSLPGLNIIDVDNSDPDFPIGLSQTEGDDPSFFITSVGTTVDAGNDGFTQFSSVCGNIYFDTNGNGTQDPGEPDLPGIDVIITDVYGNMQTVQTQTDPDGDLNGVWCADVPPGIITIDIDETDPDFPNGTTQTEGDDPTVITVIGGTTVDGGTDGFALLGGVFGTVYLDNNANGVFDPTEQGIGNLDVVITDATGYIQTVQTLPSGIWSTDVPPGPFTVDIDETDPDYPVGSTQTEGTDPSTSTAILGETINAGNDGYAYTALVCGNLYFDTNGNGMQDQGEPDLPEVDVIITFSDGYMITVTTAIDPDGDLNGVWCAEVPPGIITIDIDETDPDFPNGTTQTEGEDPTVITVISGTTIDGGTDGFALLGGVFGTVYLDDNANGTLDPTEQGIGNLDVVITDATGFIQTVQTLANGVWSTDVPPGPFTVDIDETDPDYPTGASQTEGTDPSTATALLGQTVDAGNDGYAYTALVCGNLYFDTNGNGTQDAGEPDLPEVDVIITYANGYTITVTTATDPDGDLNGVWCATVTEGEVTIDVDETDPDFPNGSTQTEGDDPTIIQVSTGQVVDGGTDGYTILGTVCGHVYFDSNGNGTQDGNESGLENIEVIITDANGIVQTVNTSVADAQNDGGFYCASVSPGTVLVDINNDDPDFPTGASQTEGDDPTSVIAIAGLNINAGEDGFALLAEVCGLIYFDSNGNGTQDAGEPELPNVDVIITDQNGFVQTVTTMVDPDGDLNGVWCATVAEGEISIDIDNDDPDLPDDAIQTEGDDPTVIVVTTGQINDGGTDGFALIGEVCGILYEDTNANGMQDPGEPGLGNVDVIITDANGITQTVTTINNQGDDNGRWCAVAVAGPVVIDIDETDADYPAGSTQTEGEDPSNVIVLLGQTVDGGADGFAYLAEVCGYIYFDSNGNGQYDPGEPDLPGIDVVITDVYGNMQTVETQTDPDGDLNGVWCALVPAGNIIIDIDESDPDFPNDVTQTEGDDPSTFDVILNQFNDAGADGFTLFAELCGHVYLDNDNNGTQNIGDEDLPDVDVIVTDANGTMYTLTTDANGNYCTMIVQGPATILVDETDVDFPFGAVVSEGANPTTANAIAGTTVDADPIGYYVSPGLCGRVFEDQNANGIMDPNEPGIPNITVVIADDSGIPQYPETDADGYYCIEVVAGGVFIDVLDTDPDFPIGAVQTQGLDPNFVVAPTNGYVDAGTDGYNIQGFLCGFVYFDNNGNGTQDPSEPGIVDLDVIVTDVDGVVHMATTDDFGEWCANVPEGTTTVELDQSDPDYPVGATQTEGDDPTTVTVLTGQSADGGNDGFLRCISINSKVFIEGALSDADGTFTYSDEMRTDLNDLNLLPGQTYLDPLFGNNYSLPGQPYSENPWLYNGLEGDLYDSEGDAANANANYPQDAVDWVLVSLRTQAEANTEICKAAALLLKDGTIVFVEEFDCCGFSESSFYLVIEHRNHLIVMSEDLVSPVNGLLTYDFSTTDSYVDFFGLGRGQKLVTTVNGNQLYVMYSGNGEQFPNSAVTDINVNDKIVWENGNNRSAVYISADYNLSGDTNVNDKGLYDINNNSFSSVPYN